LSTLPLGDLFRIDVDDPAFADFARLLNFEEVRLTEANRACLSELANNLGMRDLPGRQVDSAPPVKRNPFSQLAKPVTSGFGLAGQQPIASGFNFGSGSGFRFGSAKPNSPPLFRTEMLAQLRAQDPNVELSDVDAKIQAVWDSLTDEQKRNYVVRGRATPAKTSSSNSGSAYFAFVKQMRPQVVAQHPYMKVTEISRMLGEMWLGLTEEEKDGYRVLAKQVKPANARSNPAPGPGVAPPG
jgi:hypothetical protein